MNRRVARCPLQRRQQMAPARAVYGRQGCQQRGQRAVSADQFPRGGSMCIPTSGLLTCKLACRAMPPRMNSQCRLSIGPAPFAVNSQDSLRISADLEGSTSWLEWRIARTHDEITDRHLRPNAPSASGQQALLGPLRASNSLSPPGRRCPAHLLL